MNKFIHSRMEMKEAIGSTNGALVTQEGMKLIWKLTNIFEPGQILSFRSPLVQDNGSLFRNLYISFEHLRSFSNSHLSQYSYFQENSTPKYENVSRNFYQGFKYGVVDCPLGTGFTLQSFLGSHNCKPKSIMKH